MSAAGGGKPPKRPGRSPLSAEDRALWKHVTASVEKRRQGKPRVPEVEVEPALEPATGGRSLKSERVASAGPVSKPARRAAVREPPPPPPPAVARATATVPGVDRRKVRRIASGTIEIEARLDLHGMTQSAAHARLIGFLQNAAAQGMRTVLVITGKGGSRQQPPPSSAWWETDEIGVLRRSVPRWLAEPPLRAVVIGCQPASPRHGGEGALYILLRRRKAAGQS